MANRNIEQKKYRRKGKYKKQVMEREQTKYKYIWELETWNRGSIVGKEKELEFEHAVLDVLSLQSKKKEGKGSDTNGQQSYCNI